MARLLRVQFEGAIYHVTARGNDRRPIFLDDKDRHCFIQKLGESVDMHAIRLYAYVMMNNHYHLLFETPRANLSLFMHQFNSSYVACYNVRHQRCGHLFEGRYKAKLVEGDQYLVSLIRYIHLNPVRISCYAGCSYSEKLVALRDYAWSSHRAYCGKVRKEAYVDYKPLLSQVAAGTNRPEIQFQQYVEHGLLKSDSDLHDALVRSSKAIGRHQFCIKIEKEYKKRLEQIGQVQDVGMRRMEVAVPSEAVVRYVCRHFSVQEEFLKKRRNPHISRLIAMKLLKECSGMNHRAIAATLGIKDGSGISRKIAALNSLMIDNMQIKQSYEMLKVQLSNH